MVSINEAPPSTARVWPVIQLASSEQRRATAFPMSAGVPSWKAPRYQDHPMEVGPLSRMLMAYASGHQEVNDLVNGVLAKLNVGHNALAAANFLFIRASVTPGTMPGILATGKDCG
jgi:hypothetical protein